ncbi:hypothetical protein CPB85DRAFT_1346311 [Mucidula mucida]|nr:hypothetical protein CPB85DRAFT_1346311 [Mucidula mucida]
MSTTFLDGAGGITPVKPKSTQSPLVGYVRIQHPGYQPPRLIAMLPVYRSPSGIDGIPFSFVLDAAQILANNQPGTLRVCGTPTDLTAPDNLSLLPPGDYEYRVTTGEARYPICTSFRAWSVPSVLPAHWDITAMGGKVTPPMMGTNASEKIKTEDGQCLMTGATSRLQSCHMVPKADEQWWNDNDMNVKTFATEGIDSSSNRLTLRADLIGPGMDAAGFVIISYGGSAVCVCMKSGFEDLASEYQFRTVKIPARIHPFNMYVRLAWNLFRMSHSLLLGLQSAKNVVTIKEETTTNAPPPAKRKHIGQPGGTGDASEGLHGGESGNDGHDDDAPHLTDGGESSEDEILHSPPLDVWRWTEHDLKGMEKLDATLSTRPLARYEEATGMYPGYSQAMRLAQKYRQEHPEVSAVVHARVARVGEDDDEQQL